MQIFEKFVGNIWLIFIQFEKISVIQVLTYYNSVLYWKLHYCVCLSSRSQISWIMNFWLCSRTVSTTHLISAVKASFGRPLLSLSWIFSHPSSWNLLIHKCTVRSGIRFLYTFCRHLCIADAKRFSILRKHIIVHCGTKCKFRWTKALKKICELLANIYVCNLYLPLIEVLRITSEMAFICVSNAVRS